MKKVLLDRFLRYVSLDTRSDPQSQQTPSTPAQKDFALLLQEEILQMGIEDVSVSQKGCLMASIPANTSKNIPAIGFIAHLDTSPDMTATGVKARVHNNYRGDVILLDKEGKYCLSPAEHPDLLNYMGQTIITTDGTTLLGADNKAGIAEIMTALETIQGNPELPHGPIKVAFTPDEEIGKGADHFDVKRFGADFAYTVDGGTLGELQYENFNAAHALVRFSGKNIHPGEAKGKMRNAIHMAMDFQQLLPEKESPEWTEGYEGFFHLLSFHGDVEQATLEYIIRDHDQAGFERRKHLMRQAAAGLGQRYGKGLIVLQIKDQYYNMKSRVLPVFHVVDLAREAIEACDITPLIRPIRGGTDGSRLSFMGLPCPNLFTGGHNFHGRHEFIPLESMEKATRVILKMVSLLQQKSG